MRKSFDLTRTYGAEMFRNKEKLDAQNVADRSRPHGGGIIDEEKNAHPAEAARVVA